MTALVSYRVLSEDTAAMLHGSDVFDFAIKPDQLDAFLADPNHVMMLACHGDRLVGFASGTVLYHPDKDPTLFVNEVSVSETHRRDGIATELMTRLQDCANALGCTSVWVATEDDNAPARALYRSVNGREQLGVVVYDWGEPADPET